MVGRRRNVNKAPNTYIKQLSEGFCDLQWCLDLVDFGLMDCRNLVAYFYSLTRDLVNLFEYKKSKESYILVRFNSQKMVEVPAKKSLAKMVSSQIITSQNGFQLF